MHTFTGIGRETIRELTKQPEAKQFTLKIGKRTLIKRKQFEEYLDQMELTENMEEFLNDLIGKRMEQVYQENDGEQYDPFNEELELKVQKVIRKLPQKQRKVIFDYMTETSNNNSDLNEFYYRMGLRDGLKLKETIKTILDTLME